jgi:DNA-binding CsgD family transcriptional regulator
MVAPHELVTLLKRAVSCEHVALVRHCWASNRISTTTWSVQQPGSPQPTSNRRSIGIPSTHTLISLLWKAPLMDPTTMPGAANQILLVTGRRAPVYGLDGEAVGWQLHKSQGFKPEDVALVRIIRSLFPQPGTARIKELPTRLTATETEILVLIAEGCSAAEIAHGRGQSVRTVHKHIENVYRKIGCSDRVRAAHYAWRTGLIDLAPTDQSVAGTSQADG